jgi:hypothetical protein
MTEYSEVVGRRRYEVLKQPHKSRTVLRSGFMLSLVRTWLGGTHLVETHVWL